MNKKAYCHELARTVEAEEVWKLKYEGLGINTPLTFRCADPSCTARMVIRNCFLYFPPSQAHFRLYPREKHTNGCTAAREIKVKRAKAVKTLRHRRMALKCHL